MRFCFFEYYKSIKMKYNDTTDMRKCKGRSHRDLQARKNENGVSIKETGIRIMGILIFKKANTNAPLHKRKSEKTRKIHFF